MLARITPLILIFGLQIWCAAAIGQGLEESHPGYVEDVSLERNLKYQELIIPPLEIEDNDTKIKDFIFDPVIAKDLERRYEDRFGRTPIEQNFNRSNQFGEIEFDNGVRVSVQREAELELAFGEFMTKKLVEYHLDQYLQSSETLRPAYQIKEQLRQANLSVRGGWRFRFKYSLSGEELRMDIENPFDIDTKIYLLQEDRILRLGYALTKDLRFSTYYYDATERLQFVVSKRITDEFSVSLNEVFYTNRDISTDNRIILGFAWSQ